MLQSWKNRWFSRLLMLKTVSRAHPSMMSEINCFCCFSICIICCWSTFVLFFFSIFSLWWWVFCKQRVFLKTTQIKNEFITQYTSTIELFDRHCKLGMSSDLTFQMGSNGHNSHHLIHKNQQNRQKKNTDVNLLRGNKHQFFLIFIITDSMDLVIFSA